MGLPSVRIILIAFFSDFGIDLNLFMMRNDGSSPRNLVSPVPFDGHIERVVYERVVRGGGVQVIRDGVRPAR